MIRVIYPDGRSIEYPNADCVTWTAEAVASLLGPLTVGNTRVWYADVAIMPGMIIDDGSVN